MLNIDNKEYVCHLGYALEMLGGKWKVVVICNLNGNNMRYGELHRKIGNISHKMFSATLKELEDEGLIARTVYPDVPIKVEYCLTPQGKHLFDILDSLRSWTVDYLEQQTVENMKQVVGK